MMATESDDIYKIDKGGNISLVEKTDDDFDTLYAVNDPEPYSTDDCEEIDYSKSITVEKGILNNIEHAIDNVYTNTEYDFMKVEGDKAATQLFEFVAENTNVEWSQMQYGENSNYVTTAHQPFAEPSSVALLMKTIENGTFGSIRQTTHSHPNFPITGEGASPGDFENAKGVEFYNRKNNAQVKTRVYDAKRKKYTNYNSQGNVKQ
jgi:JAB-like toxin  1